MNKLFEKGLEFLKLKEKGLTLCELMKVLNEEYQTFGRNIYYDT